MLKFDNNIRRALIASIILSVTGCTLEPMYNVSVGDSDYPSLNNKPKRIVYLTGSASPDITIGLTAIYTPTLKKKGCRSVRFQLGVGYIESQYSVKVPVRVKHENNKLSAQVVIDKYRRNTENCKWQFTYLELNLSKNNLKSLPYIIIWQPLDDVKSLERMELMIRKDKSYTDNSPIILACDFNKIARLNKYSKAQACKTPNRFGHDKKILIYSTKDITLNIIDL